VCKQEQTCGELFLVMFHGKMPNREAEMIPNRELEKLGNGGLKKGVPNHARKNGRSVRMM
jgi:hypothetical protein